MTDQPMAALTIKQIEAVSGLLSVSPGALLQAFRSVVDENHVIEPERVAEAL
jgi:hypothetical protein